MWPWWVRIPSKDFIDAEVDNDANKKDDNWKGGKQWGGWVVRCGGCDAYLILKWRKYEVQYHGVLLHSWSCVKLCQGAKTLEELRQQGLMGGSGGNVITGGRETISLLGGSKEKYWNFDASSYFYIFSFQILVLILRVDRNKKSQRGDVSSQPLEDHGFITVSRPAFDAKKAKINPNKILNKTMFSGSWSEGEI